MRFALTVTCDTLAFEDNPEIELARILRDVAKRVSEQAEFKQVVYDIDGNKVGATSFDDVLSKDKTSDDSQSTKKQRFPKRA